MALPDWSGTRTAFVAEDEYGVIPATPSFTVLRTTRAGVLSTQKATGVSDEIRADRNVVDEFQLSQDCAGDYPLELSYSAFDPLIEAALFGNFASQVLKNGVTRKSFTIEEKRVIAAGTASYSRFRGAMMNRLRIESGSRQKVAVTLGVMAQRELLSAGAPVGATYAAASTKPIMTAVNAASLTVGDLPSPKVKSFWFEVNNNLRVRPVVGSLYSEEFGAGKCDVTGELELYFDSQATYQEVLDHATGAVAVVLGMTTGEKYRIDLPRIIFTTGQIPPGGNSDDIMIRLPIRAVYDPTEDCSIKITKAVA